MSTLVFLEHHEGAIQKGSLGVLGKAASLGDGVDAVVIGFGVREVAATAGRYGASTVLVADDDAGHVPAERCRTGEHAERALLDRAFVVLEEDQRRHRSFFSASQSTSFSAAEPSSSILTWSPFAGGGCSAITLVREPAVPARSASAPISASVSVSVGFDLAPMIPFSDG